jgi:hypothetical protein
MKELEAHEKQSKADGRFVFLRRLWLSQSPPAGGVSPVTTGKHK